MIVCSTLAMTNPSRLFLEIVWTFLVEMVAQTVDSIIPVALLKRLSLQATSETMMLDIFLYRALDVCMVNMSLLRPFIEKFFRARTFRANPAALLKHLC